MYLSLASPLRCDRSQAARQTPLGQPEQGGRQLWEAAVRGHRTRPGDHATQRRRERARGKLPGREGCRSDGGGAEKGGASCELVDCTREWRLRESTRLHESVEADGIAGGDPRRWQ